MITTRARKGGPKEHRAKSKLAVWNLFSCINNWIIVLLFCTLSGCIGKVVVSHVAVARSSPAEDALILYYARGDQGVLPMRIVINVIKITLITLMSTI